MTRYANQHGSFHIEEMPCQSQLALCHSFFIDVKKQGKGHGKALKHLQMETLRDLRYDFAVCTVDAANVTQQAVLKKNGWRRLAVFRNSKTGGKTQLWGAPVKREK